MPSAQEIHDILSTELPDSAECAFCGNYARISAVGTECTGDLVCVHCAQLMEWEQMPEAEYLLTECEQCMDRGCEACTLPPTMPEAAPHRETSSALEISPELFANVCDRLACARRARWIILSADGEVQATDYLLPADTVLFDSEAE